MPAPVTSSTATHIPPAGPAAATLKPCAELGVRLEAVLQRLSDTSGTRPRFRVRSNRLLIDGFHQLCRRLDVQMLLECGAHAAEASVRFRREGGARALAVEANPYTWRDRTQAAAAAGVETLHAALGAHAGTAVLQVPNPQGVAEPQPGNASLRPRAADDTPVVEVTVPLCTVDQLVAARAPTGALALWVDVEGMALEVLKGAAATLQHADCRVLLVEVEAHAYWQDQAIAQDVDAYLQAAGWTALACDVEYPLQYNLLYVRSADCPALARWQSALWRRLARRDPWLRLALYAPHAWRQTALLLRTGVIRLLGEARWKRLRGHRTPPP